MKKSKNDWYQRNFWWILVIAMSILALIIVTAAFLVHFGLLIALIAPIFGIYVSIEMRKITQREGK